MVVREIAYLLTLIDDPTGVSMYVDKLSAISGKKTLWREAINAEKKRIEEEEKQSGEIEREAYPPIIAKHLEKLRGKLF